MLVFLQGVLLGLVGKSEIWRNLLVLGLQLLGLCHVSVLFLLRLLGFIERGALAGAPLLPLLCAGGLSFLSPSRLVLGDPEFQ